MHEGYSESDTTWEVHRRIALPALRSEAAARRLEGAFQKLAGVRRLSLQPDHRRIEVDYDVRKLEYRTLLGALARCGFPPRNTALHRLRAAWFQFTDTNARANARASPSACCNRPPK